MAINNKKAFEVEFHWIFILIAGAAILAFFFVMAEKQKTISQEKLSLELSTQFDAAFISAIQSKGTTQTMPLPSEGIEINCGKTQLCDCKYTVLGRPTSFGDKIIFAPNKLDDYEAQIKTFDWTAPFRATNFLFMTTTKIKYVIVYSDTDAPIRELEIQLLKDLPATLKLQTTTDISKIVYDEDKIRLVFLTNPDPTLLNTILSANKRKDINAVYINKQNNEATFYNKKQNSNSFEQTTLKFLADSTSADSVNNALMYATIFAEDPHLYECQSKEAYKKLSYIAMIIHERAKELSSQMQDKPQCATLYPIQTGQTLDNLKKSAQQASNDLNTAGNILPLAQQLQTQNKELLTTSCPVIY